MKTPTEFERDGVEVQRNVFDQGWINRLRADIFLCFRQGKCDIQWKDNAWPALMFWPRRHSYWCELTTRSLKDHVMSHLGPNVRQLNNQVYFRLPGDGDAFNWHQDITFRKGCLPGIERGYIQTVIAIDPMTNDSGALKFMAKSLADMQMAVRGTPELRNKPAYLPGVTTITAEPGDLITWGLLTPHCSTPNVSQHSRMTYMNGFAADEYLEDDRFDWYLKDGELV